MNKNFKVVFSKARGALMVVNELTSSVQAKGTKTVIAATVASLVAGGAIAKEIPYEQSSGNSGYSATTAGNLQMEFEADNVLNMTITGKVDTRAYGLLATGADSVYTNKGTINLNLAADENATQAYRVKGMMADNNGTAVNEGTITVRNAYGMTVGSTGKNTITNTGTIDVKSGVAMEVAPTGIQGSGQEGSNAVATNEGTIKVAAGSIGVLMSGTGNTFTNKGTLDATGAKAVHLQQEKGKRAENNKLVFESGSQTNGDIYVGNNVTNTTIEFAEGANFSGRIVVRKAGEGVSGTSITASGQTFSDQQTGAIQFYDGTNSSISLTNVNFTGNTSFYGGAVYSYAENFVQNGGAYHGNKAVDNESGPNAEGKVEDGAFGGALMLKGNYNVILTDVDFAKNSASAANGMAYGGAICADFSTGNNGEEAGSTDLTLKITQNMTYAGNTVSSGSTGKVFDTYGYHVPTAAAGGFLFLDRGASVAFNVESGATLTIGSSVTTDDTDSIASSIPNTNTTNNGGKHALVKKEGAGELVINSNLDKYYGTVQVNGGQMTVNSKWNIKNEVTVANGGTLALSSFDTMAADDSGNQNVTGTSIGGSIVVNGTLQTSSAQIFHTGLNAEGTNKNAEALLGKDVTFNEGSTLALTDAFYNLDYAQSAGALITNGKVTMLGDLINKDTVNESTLDGLEQVGENVDLPNVTVKAEDKNIQIGGTLVSGEDATTSLREESLSVGSIDLGEATRVTVAGGKTLTLAGNGEQIIKTSDAAGAKIVVENGTLALGGTVSNGGTVEDVEVQTNGQMKVVGDATYTIDKLSGSGNVYVGTDAQAGEVIINDISEMTGMIFADPEKASSASETSGGSVAGFSDAATPAKAYLVAGRNALWATDAAKAEGVAAFNKIGSAQGLAWGEDVTAALYVGKTLQLGTTGSVLVDGSATSDNVANRVNGTATVNAKGMLIVNQNVGEAIVGGNVVLAEGSYLGVVNSSVGEFKLASGTVTDNGTEVVTDNPFIQGSINAADKTVVNKLDAESGLGAIASTGVQAMARRADFVMTETVANRTSLDQPMHAGVNLWADVSGERYEADKLDNNGSFRADAAYATFGGDVEVLEGLTAGLGLQYGDASLRSDVSGIKNDITSYGLTAYAGKSFGAAKVVGELAWLKSENDITAHQTALNQKLDANIYSAGVRAQYELAAGSFKFVPSIGLRVSRLETDDMTVGSIKVDEGDLTYVQMPISLRISGFEADAAGWTLAPSFKVAYVPTFGDKEVKVLGYSQDVLDMSPVQADFGLRAVNGNLMFNVDMMLGGGEAGTSSIGGKVGVKYAF